MTSSRKPPTHGCFPALTMLGAHRKSGGITNFLARSVPCPLPLPAEIPSPPGSYRTSVAHRCLQGRTPEALALASQAAVHGRYMTPSHSLGSISGVWSVLRRSPQTIGDASFPALLQTPRWPVSSTFRDHRIQFSPSFSSWVVRRTSSQIPTITSSRSQPGCRPATRLRPQLDQPAVRPLDGRDTSQNAPCVRSRSTAVTVRPDAVLRRYRPERALQR